MRRASLLGIAALLAVPAASPAALERLTPAGSITPPDVVASSDDGSRVVFNTAAALVPQDTDTRSDAYERVGGELHLLSLGPDGGNDDVDAFARGASRDATHVFIETRERLIASADTDSRIDVYEHDADGLHLRTAGGDGPGTPGNGDDPADDATFVRCTEDGSQLLFRTEEALDDADTEGDPSLYERTGTSMVFLNDLAEIGADQVAQSADGSRLVYASRFRVTSDDNDPLIPGVGSYLDVFATDANPIRTTTLLSTGPQNGDGPFDAHVVAASRNAGRVVFTTDAPLVSQDGDLNEDFYERTESGLTLLTGPAGTFGGSPLNPLFHGISDDGLTVLFTTREQLTPGDDDGRVDAFVTGPLLGGPQLVSTGAAGGQGPSDVSAAGLSADGTHAYVTTAESLTPDDTDGGSIDLYEREGGTTRLVSTGPADAGAADPEGAQYAGSSPHGGRVFFTSGARLTAGDTDDAVDLYVREAGSTTLLSTGPAGGNGIYDVVADGVSADGTRAYFRSVEPLTDIASTAGWSLYAATIEGAAAAPPATTPTAAAAELPKAKPAIEDLTAPKLSATLVKGQSLRRLRSTGKLKLKLGCDEACTLTATLELKVARAAGVRGAATRAVKLGKVTVRLTAKGARTVTLKLSKAGKKALRRAGSRARLTLRLSADDRAGNHAARAVSVKLRR